jgi:hypothetical protein
VSLHGPTCSSALLAGVIALSSACNSPVNDERIECLGGEQPEVPPSEFHRPGQPCVTCHGEYAADSPILAVGGTIFATPSDPVPVEGVLVRLTDAKGTVVEKTTNCIGNFQVTADEWTPAFPLRAEIECPTRDPARPVRRFVMGTRITRDGSCAGCHIGPPAQNSPGWIYCAEIQPEPPYAVNDSCQGLPYGLPASKCPQDLLF